jgi:predicted Ser/Thr protein kinase
MKKQHPNRRSDETARKNAAAREEMIGELLNEFFDLRHRGEPTSVEEFLAAHTEYADELRHHFEGLALLDEVGAGLDDTTRVARIGSSASENSDQAEHHGAVLPKIEGYEILREIGRGGMGIVYRAVQCSTKRAVAVKVLLEGPLASPSVRQRFEREIELAAQLRHVNIIPIYDSGRSGGRLYYAMEYVRGRPLGEYLQQAQPSLDQKLRLFLRICSAVNHAHLRGVVHRDLKPANILIDSDGEPRVHDFGLAKVGGAIDTGTSLTAQIIGTPAYMSPEQVLGDPGAIDQRTDVYSLGVILFETLTGQMPYATDGPLSTVLNNITQAIPSRPSRLCREINGDIETVVLKALEKKRDDRYQSVDALMRDVQHFLSGEPIQAKRAGVLYLLSMALWPYRHMAMVGVALLAMAVLAGFVILKDIRKIEQMTLEGNRMELELQRAKLAATEAQLLAEREKQEQKQQIIQFLSTAIERVSTESPEAARRLRTEMRQWLDTIEPQTPRSLITNLSGALLEGIGEFVDERTGEVILATQPTEEEAEPPIDASSRDAETRPDE